MSLGRFLSRLLVRLTRAVPDGAMPTFAFAGTGRHKGVPYDRNVRPALPTPGAWRVLGHGAEGNFRGRLTGSGSAKGWPHPQFLTLTIYGRSWAALALSFEPSVGLTKPSDRMAG